MTFKKKYHNWGEGKVSYIEWGEDNSMPGLQFCHATGFNSLTSVSYTHLTLPTKA